MCLNHHLLLYCCKLTILCHTWEVCRNHHKGLGWFTCSWHDRLMWLAYSFTLCEYCTCLVPKMKVFYIPSMSDFFQHCVTMFRLVWGVILWSLSKSLLSVVSAVVSSHDVIRPVWYHHASLQLVMGRFDVLQNCYNYFVFLLSVTWAGKFWNILCVLRLWRVGKDN